MNIRNEKGVTLLGLTVTITMLVILALLMVGFLGGEKIFSSAKKISFETKVTQYRDQVTKYYTRQMSLYGTTDIDTVDPQEISQIIQGIDSEDLEKFVIQNNELRYIPEAVNTQEEKWLIQLGIAAMTAVFAITFMSKGSVYQTIQATKVTFPSVNPTSDGENFTGWYYDQETTNKAVAGTDLTQDITLYAKWETAGYTMTFISEGATYSTLQGTTITFPSTEPTREGYNFMGWYYDKATTDKATTGEAISQNTNLYARWALNGEVGDYLYLSDNPYAGYTEEEILEWADQNNVLGFGLVSMDNGNRYDILVYVPYVSLAEEEGYQINSTIKSYELLNASDMPETVISRSEQRE